MVIATDTDKVLGAVLIERVAYNKKLWSEHLSDRVAYKEIPLHQIHTVKMHMKYKLGDFSPNAKRSSQNMN